jgi:predicted ester cyclase
MAENLQLMTRFYEEILVGGNLDLIDEMVDDGMVDHEQGFPGQPQGKAGVPFYVKAIRKAFPDLEAKVGQSLEAGDVAAAETTLTGTHDGELMGVPPTGKRVSFDTIDIIKVKDGKVVEHWGVTDAMGLMQQLGAIPEPSA